MGKRVDLEDIKFGRLIVVSYAGKNKQGRALWNCRCDCGNLVIARADALKSGDKQSCGCLNRENKSKECIERNTIHGLAHTRLYRVWCDMRRRCNNAKTPEYKNYGARGIAVCSEWNRNFQTFNDWAVKNGYDETAARGDCTIDRIDVNGDYCPENCRFVNLMVQGSNKRNNRRITHNGITMTQSEWARYYNKNRAYFCSDPITVERRMNKCDALLMAEYARRKF